ncbi:MAG: amidase [Nitrospinae bacterium]|nr:amidase [Nitrospinota bacterium]
MNPDELLHRPITELSALIQADETKPSEVIETHIARTQGLDATINAFTRTTFDLAREQAERLDSELVAGNYRGPLHGIPVALKDLFDLEGHPTTAGSRILGKSAAVETAECVRRLIEAGAVIIGKTNLQEFARGGTGANSAFGPARNPWSLDHTPGGSSSGSAACVAAGMAAAALGSDTGGSVRLPASFCNLVGIRSTYGRVSRAGAVPLGLSFDNVGPLTRTVEDAALILQAIAGSDPKDPTTGTGPAPDFLETVNEGVRGMTLGVATNHFWPGEDPEAEAIVREGIARFEALGARVVEVEIPWARLGQVAYAATVGPEGAEYHRKFLENHRDGYVSPGADFFEYSLFIPGWRYVQAQKARTFFIRQAAEVFRKVDAVLTPTVAIAPPTIADCLDGMKMWPIVSDNTAAFSTIGNPVLQVPCGFTKARLPVGLQIAGRWGDEARLFRIGKALEDDNPLWQLRPPEVDEQPPPEDFPEAAASPPQEMTETEAAAHILAMAKTMGYRIDKDKISPDGLAQGVTNMLAGLEKLDDLALDDCERAETLNLLDMDFDSIPSP